MINHAKSGNRWRFVHSGEHDAGLNLIDLNLYDTSLFANACVFTAGTTMLIFDAGTSATVNQILTYLDFHAMHPRRVWVVPSHHHFDHAGGLKPLVESVKKRGMQVSVLTTPLMAGILENLPRETSKAVHQFNTMAGTIQEIDPGDITVIEPGKNLDVDDRHSIVLVPTPGHCPDHVSLVVYRDGSAHLCFFGEALGINLKKELSPLPACVAPSFDSIQYKKSVGIIKAIQPRIGVFSHVGGVRAGTTSSRRATWPWNGWKRSRLSCRASQRKAGKYPRGT